jgi:hypothetical protein
MGLPPQGKSPSQNKSTTAIIWLRVRFELGARNGLRRVVFAMEKNNKPNGVPQWVVAVSIVRAPVARRAMDADGRSACRSRYEAEREGSHGGCAWIVRRASGPCYRAGGDDTLAGKRGELAVAEARQSVKDIVK